MLACRLIVYVFDTKIKITAQTGVISISISSFQDKKQITIAWANSAPMLPDVIGHAVWVPVGKLVCPDPKKHSMGLMCVQTYMVAKHRREHKRLVRNAERSDDCMKVRTWMHKSLVNARKSGHRYFPSWTVWTQTLSVWDLKLGYEKAAKSTAISLFVCYVLSVHFAQTRRSGHSSFGSKFTPPKIGEKS